MPLHPPIIYTCPDWIIERVVSLLDLADIRNLRLASKTISIKSSQGRFRRLLQSKNVDLTSETLQTFMEAKNDLSRLKNLNIVGLARKTNNPENDVGKADEKQEMEKETHLLTEAFNEIAKCKDDGCLESLTLRITIVYKDGTRHLPADNDRLLPWRHMPKRAWACAVYTWQVAMRALAASGLRINMLNAFNDADMQQCSIPCDCLTVVNLQDTGLAESLAELKSLSLSICDRIFDLDEDLKESDEEYVYDYYKSLNEAKVKEATPRDFQAEADEDNNFVGVAKLVKLCSQIKDFELHHFHNQRSQKPRIVFHTERILQHLVELEGLPRLRKSKLRGILTIETDLLNFIIRTDPSDLTLGYVALKKGTFASIINHCTSDQAHLHALVLDSLEENISSHRKMVLFPWHKECKAIVASVVPGQAVCESFKCEGDIRQPIRFTAASTHFQGSPFNYAYDQRRMLEYGAW